MTELVTAAELPPNWAAFVDAVAGGDAPEKVAKALGYAEPRRTAALLMKHPTVRKALVSASHAWLEWRGARLALDVVEEILTDRDPKAKAVRAKLALGVLDRIQPPKDERTPGDKPLGDMTMRELEEYVAAQRANRPPAPEMRDVTPGRSAG